MQQCLKKTGCCILIRLSIPCAVRHIWLVGLMFKSPSVPIGTPDSYFDILPTKSPYRT